MDYEEALDILGVASDTPLEEVKSVYRGLILSLHPDHYQGEDSRYRIRELNDAYKIVMGKARDVIEEVAVNDVKESTTRPSDKVSIWYKRGLAYNDMGLFPDAIACYNKGLEVDPRNTGIWNEKGYSFGEWGYFQEAIECCDKVLELDHINAVAKHNKKVLTSALKQGTIEEWHSKKVRTKVSLKKASVTKSGQAERYRLLLENLRKEYEAGNVPEDIYEKLKTEYGSKN